MLHLELYGTSLPVVLGTLVAFVLIVILVGKRLIAQQTKIIAKKGKRVPWQRVNLISVYRPQFMCVGFIVSLGTCLALISWTQITPDEKVIIIDDEYDEEDDEVQPPILPPPPVKPPLPPPPVIEEVPDITDDIEQPEFEDPEIDIEDTDISPPDNADDKSSDKDQKASNTKSLPPRPDFPPPPPDDDEEEIFAVVEQMPRFPGCEMIAGSIEEKQDCAVKKLLSFIYEHATYTAEARENNIQGTAVIQFVVNKEGRIMDVKVLRDPGGGLGQEVKNAVLKMNTLASWIPGKQRGRTVSVKYTLPVKFHLN